MRAVGRAIAERSAPHGAITCRSVFVGRGRGVSFRAPGARRGSAREAALSLARDLRERRSARLAEQLLAAYALAADDWGVLARLPPSARRTPFVIAVGGLVASGKSTVAKLVSRRLGAPRVAADRVREALLAAAGAERAHELTWSPSFRDRIYAGMRARAGRVLASGRPVVLDACFPSQRQRRAAAALAARHGAGFLFVWCAAPRLDLAARLRRRDVRDGGAPGAWERLARDVEARFEPPQRSERAFTVPLDTSLPREAWLRAIERAQKECA